ncbi:MAG: 50S ribosomal protein L23 [Candidatus Dormibacteria bacterium]
MTAGLGFHQILIRPVVSEKSYRMGPVGKYAFLCHPRATKVQIAQAVEQAFSDQRINVTGVNTITIPGKMRNRSRGGNRVSGKSPDRKKAIVTLAPGQKIDGLFEGI